MRLASDLQVNTTSYVNVLTQSISITAANTRVLVIADGRYFPVDKPAGSMRVAIDGSEAYTTYAINHWGSAKTNASVQHSFNVLAYAVLQPGTHTINLRAGSHPSRPGRFSVGSYSGMSVIINPSQQTLVSSLSGESAQINVTTYAPPGVNIVEGSANRPLVSVLSNSVTNNTAATVGVATLISGRAFQSCTGNGDALWGISQDNVCQWTDSASWAVNDIDPGAETQAPMYAHAFHAVGPGKTSNIAFKASELAFGSDQAGSASGAHENAVCYKAGSAKIISIVGSAVAGGAGGNSTFCSTYTWKCVASTTGAPGCPTQASDVTLASKTVNIPSGHNGVFEFSAKTRTQLDNADGFSTAILGLKIDGVQQGTLGIQQIRAGFGQASRTLTASYLSASGPNSAPLAPGPHLVEVYINVQGAQIKNASVPQELALVYFD